MHLPTASERPPCDDRSGKVYLSGTSSSRTSWRRLPEILPGRLIPRANQCVGFLSLQVQSTTATIGRDLSTEFTWIKIVNVVIGKDCHTGQCLQSVTELITGNKIVEAVPYPTWDRWQIPRPAGSDALKCRKWSFGFYKRSRKSREESSQGDAFPDGI